MQKPIAASHVHEHPPLRFTDTTTSLNLPSTSAYLALSINMCGILGIFGSPLSQTKLRTLLIKNASM